MPQKAARPRGWRRALAAGAAALALLGAFSAPSQAMELAVQDDSVFVQGRYGNRELAFTQSRALGMRWLRINVVWSDYVRDGFRKYDDAVNAAQAHGFSVQMTIVGTPAYDRGDRRLSWYKPNPARFASFATTVATHFRGRVMRYSLWNEPNLGRWLAPSRQAPLTYRRLVLAAYPALKRVDGRNQVLIGELTSSHDPLGFLRKTASGLKADGLAYHPFEFYRRPGSGRSTKGFIGINSTPTIKAALRDLARRGKLTTLKRGSLPLYFTEFAYLTDGCCKTSEARRADWAPRAYKYARKQGVKQMLYYQLWQSPERDLGGEPWDSGIVGIDGSPLRTYTALLSASRTGFR
ncbi:MAG: cellulase family glycosylhydrolase [Actinomycetota bacterium]|nr:cellulase family glycosylhydrolase [Actinomycetota bacterium]